MATTLTRLTISSAFCLLLTMPAAYADNAAPAAAARPQPATEPGCDVHPNGPWFGFFSYKFATHISIGWSARGCFADQASCQQWLSRVSTKASKGTIIQNSCRKL